MKQIAFLIISILMLGCSSKPVTKPNPAASFVSFWEGFDFSNKAMTNNPGVTEAKFKDFCGDLIFSSKTERKQQIDHCCHVPSKGARKCFSVSWNWQRNILPTQIHR